MRYDADDGIYIKVNAFKHFLNLKIKVANENQSLLTLYREEIAQPVGDGRSSEEKAVRQKCVSLERGGIHSEWIIMIR
jgi:hypothetical protein